MVGEVKRLMFHKAYRTYWLQPIRKSGLTIVCDCRLKLSLPHHNPSILIPSYTSTSNDNIFTIRTSPSIEQYPSMDPPTASPIHISSHPSIQTKLSRLRSRQTTSSLETKALVHDITLILASEALSSGDEHLNVRDGPKVRPPNPAYPAFPSKKPLYCIIPYIICWDNN